MTVKRWCWRKGCWMENGWVAWSSHWLQRRVHSGFFISSPTCGAEGEREERGVKAASSQMQKNESDCYYTCFWNVTMQQRLSLKSEIYFSTPWIWVELMTCLVNIIWQKRLSNSKPRSQEALNASSHSLIILLPYVNRPVPAGWVQRGEPIYPRRSHPRQACS